MGHRGLPAKGDDVAFSDDLLNFYVDVRERSAEGAVSLFEGLGAFENTVGTNKSVCLSMRVKHPVDGFFTLLVPNLLEPLPRELLVCLRHGGKDTPHSLRIASQFRVNSEVGCVEFYGFDANPSQSPGDSSNSEPSRCSFITRHCSLSKNR